MADKVTFDTSEVRLLAARIEVVAPKMRERVRGVLETAVDRLKAEAVDRAPFRTGELKASIRRGRADNEDLYRRVYTTVPQGFFQEYGTSRHGPQPWATPALAAEEPRFVADIQNAMIKVWDEL